MNLVDRVHALRLLLFGGGSLLVLLVILAAIRMLQRATRVSLLGVDPVETLWLLLNVCALVRCG